MLMDFSSKWVILKLRGVEPKNLKRPNAGGSGSDQTQTEKPESLAQTVATINTTLLKAERLPHLATADGLRGAPQEHAREGPRRRELQPPHIRVAAHQVHGESR